MLIESLLGKRLIMNYDWIVVGAGFTGAALGYELVKKGFSVLLLEQDAIPENATRYSYGGLAFWSATTPQSRQLCDEARTRYDVLPQELGANIEFRELDLLLTIDVDSDVDAIYKSYARFATQPILLDVQQACELEPLLNKNSISAALTVKHGHINPQKTTQAYIQAFLRLGGKLKIAQVLQFNYQNSQVLVKTTTDTYDAEKTVVCAGGISRQLLKESGISIQLYFTHAEILETPPVDIKLSTLVMPAILQRFQLEAKSSQNDALWCQPNNEPETAILDAGAVQFLDGSLRIGQISRIFSARDSKEQSEEWLRSRISQIIPALANIPAKWHRCLVAFSKDSLPLVGAIPNSEGIYIFSGFSNPLVLVPPLAERFANWVSGSGEWGVGSGD
jgi:glycine/D-amino acid oxidase-like deaminating enzyme